MVRAARSLPGAGDAVEIQALVSDYVLAIDERDLELFGELWTADAAFALSRDDVGLGAPFHGREAIVAGFAAYFEREDGPEPEKFTRHLCTPSRIAIEGGEVRGKTGMLSVAQPLAGRDGLRCRVSRTGVYHDRFAREAGGWRFAERLLAWDPPVSPDATAG